MTATAWLDRDHHRVGAVEMVLEQDARRPVVPRIEKRSRSDLATALHPCLIDVGWARLVQASELEDSRVAAALEVGMQRAGALSADRGRVAARVRPSLIECIAADGRTDQGGRGEAGCGPQQEAAKSLAPELLAGRLGRNRGLRRIGADFRQQPIA